MFDANVVSHCFRLLLISIKKIKWQQTKPYLREMIVFCFFLSLQQPIFDSVNWRKKKKAINNRNRSPLWESHKKNRSVLIFLWCCFELCITSIIFIIIAIIAIECGECKLHGSSHPTIYSPSSTLNICFFHLVFIFSLICSLSLPSYMTTKTTVSVNFYCGVFAHSLSGSCCSTR